MKFSFYCMKSRRKPCETGKHVFLLIQQGGPTVQPNHYVIRILFTKRGNIYCGSLTMIALDIVLELSLLYPTLV